MVGATDPSKASKASIRGMLYDHWKELGLDRQPSMSENGFHASASPWEGLLERMNWLQRKLDEDPFGQELLAAGISKDMLKVIREDPTVMFNNQSNTKDVAFDLIDYLEDKSATECINIMKKVKTLKSSNVNELYPNAPSPLQEFR